MSDEKTKMNLGKVIIGFGIVTILSAIYLIIQKDYISGISGAMVGALLIFLSKGD